MICMCIYLYLIVYIQYTVQVVSGLQEDAGCFRTHCPRLQLFNPLGFFGTLDAQPLTDTMNAAAGSEVVPKRSGHAQVFRVEGTSS